MNNPNIQKKAKLISVAPRGFCAGVDRAVKIVEKAIEKYGSPVYVRHEIVHNEYVVNSLRNKGAIFVEELSEIPNNDRPVIFSAHGVAKSVFSEAQNREILYIDATCPLVGRVHRDATRHHAQGYKIILIGHKNHPEVIGTTGQLPAGAVTLVESIKDVENLDFRKETKLAWCSQTTLSVDDTKDIISALETKYPDIKPPAGENICYATTNRQEAVKKVASESDIFFVIGAKNSSNSNRLVETAKKYGCDRSILISNASQVNWEEIANTDNLKSDILVIGLTAGASAPEILVQDFISEAEKYLDLTKEERKISEEDVVFQLPKNLR